MNTLIKNIYRKFVRPTVPPNGDVIEMILKKELIGCRRILDLGCSFTSPLELVRNDKSFSFYAVGVDAFLPAIEKNIASGKKIHDEYINKNILDINFPEDSFDCILLLDVIEHLEENDFLELLPKLKKISKKIVIITPNGFVGQGEYEGNKYQKHLSGWTIDKMKALGFQCFGLSGWKALRGEMWKSKIHPEFLGNFISDITQLFVYKRPSLAYHLVCVWNRL